MAAQSAANLEELFQARGLKRGAAPVGSTDKKAKTEATAEASPDLSTMLIHVRAALAKVPSFVDLDVALQAAVLAQLTPQGRAAHHIFCKLQTNLASFAGHTSEPARVTRQVIAAFSITPTSNLPSRTAPCLNTSASPGAWGKRSKALCEGGPSTLRK